MLNEYAAQARPLLLCAGLTKPSMIICASTALHAATCSHGFTLPTMTLVQNGAIAWDRPAVTRPPGGQNAQHFTGVWGNLQQTRRDLAKHTLQNRHHFFAFKHKKEHIKCSLKLFSQGHLTDHERLAKILLHCHPQSLEAGKKDFGEGRQDSGAAEAQCDVPGTQLQGKQGSNSSAETMTSQHQLPTLLHNSFTLQLKRTNLCVVCRRDFTTFNSRMPSIS